MSESRKTYIPILQRTSDSHPLPHHPNRRCHFHQQYHRFRRRSLPLVALSCLIFFILNTTTLAAAQNETGINVAGSDNANASTDFNLTGPGDETNALNDSWPIIMDDNNNNDTKTDNSTFRIIIKPKLHRIALVMMKGTVVANETMAIQSMVEDSELHLEIFPIEDIDPSFHNFKEAVETLEPEKPSTIIGPYSLAFAVAAQHLGIPYIVTSPIPVKQPVSDFFIIRLFPESNVFARSVEDMLKYYNLKKIVVFFASEKGEAIVEKLAGIPKVEVTTFYVSPDTVGDIREQLKTVRDKYYTSFVGILDMNTTMKLLDEAVSLSMFSPRYKWLMVNMGMQEYDLEKYVDSYANVTVIRLMMDYNSTGCDLEAAQINLKRSLLHDAFKLTKQLPVWNNSQTDPKHQLKMLSDFKRLKMHGCTGDLMFSEDGHRVESFLQLMTLEGYRAGAIPGLARPEAFIEEACGIEKTQTSAAVIDKKGDVHILAPSQDVIWCNNDVSGTWRSNRSLLTERIDPSKSYSIVTKLTENVFGNTPLRITTNIEPPFVQEKEKDSLETNHPLYEGFLIDILVELSELLGFTYNVTMVPDGKFGSYKGPERGWTGMIRQLLDDKADIALAPFQMTLERAGAVDFTKPFMTKGTTVVIKRPEQKIWMFQFLSPLNKIVWFAIFIAFIGVSLMLFAVSRVNSDKQAKYTSNLRESFWYIWGTLLRGSLSGSPSAISSRIVSSVWWFFCLIISSIYTANLAAFLTITNNDVGMSTAADLALQSEYSYGTVDGSATETFFKHTKMNYYSQMWAHMKYYNESKEPMLRRVEQGFRRVKLGKYAFIWDSPTIRHTISKDCDLMELGSPFDLKGYGFPFQKNALYGERLSWALLTLNDRGRLYKLERKWWRPQFCPDQKRSAKSQSLQLETVAGMYVIILSGAIISTLICLVQHLIREFRGKKKRAAMEEHNKDGTEGGGIRAGNYSSEQTPRGDENILYANHSPLQFRSVAEWT